MSSVAAWKKRFRRKGPFIIYRVADHQYGGHTPAMRKWREENKLFDHKDMKKGFAYHVVFRDKGKVKLGILKDGMCCRYGIDTYGTLTGTSISGFWQTTAGVLSEDEMKFMIAFAKGENREADVEFDLDRLEDITW